MLLATKTLLGPKPGRSAYLESYRVLRSSLLALKEKESFTSLLITSTTEGAGKTTISINLGTILAMADKKVIVVDADFLGESIANVFELIGRPGFTDVCQDKASIDSVLVPTELPHLSIMTAGTEPERGPELAATASAQRVFGALKERAEFVLIDTMPIGISGAALSLGQAADRVLVVVPARSRVQAVRRKLAMLKGAGADLAGLVVNNVMHRDSLVYQSHHRYYGYYHRTGAGG